MSLRPADVSRLADLARIELRPDELERLASQLDVILEAVAVVSAAVDETIPATSHALPLRNVYRADEVRPSLDQAQVLAMAPQRQDGRFRVPQILQED